MKKKKKKGKMKPTQEGMERDEGVTLETLYNKGSSEWWQVSRMGLEQSGALKHIWEKHSRKNRNIDEGGREVICWPLSTDLSTSHGNAGGFTHLLGDPEGLPLMPGREHTTYASASHCIPCPSLATVTVQGWAQTKSEALRCNETFDWHLRKGPTSV